jgi:hypothetical protein
MGDLHGERRSSDDVIAPPTYLIAKAKHGLASEDPVDRRGPTPPVQRLSPDYPLTLFNHLAISSSIFGWSVSTRGGWDGEIMYCLKYYWGPPWRPF